MTIVAPLDIFEASATIVITSDVSVVGWALRARLTAPMVTDVRVSLDVEQAAVIALPPSLIGRPYQLHLIDPDQREHLIAKGLLSAGSSSDAQTFVYSSAEDSVDTFETVIYDQDTAADVWTIAHELGRYPSVNVVDSAGSTVEGDVQYIDANNVIITFSAPFSGRAFIGG